MAGVCGKLTRLRCGCRGLLLGHLEEQPITHPGLKALRDTVRVQGKIWLGDMVFYVFQ